MVNIQVPVAGHIQQWWLAHYGAEPVDVRRNTPILGALCFCFFANYEIGSRKAITDLPATTSATIALRLEFVKDLALLDARRIEEFGYILESAIDLHRLGFADGYTSVKASTAEAVRRYVAKYNLNLSTHATVKEVERFRNLVAGKTAQAPQKVGYQGGKMVVVGSPGLAPTII
jgi:hypothetical protein